MAALPPEFRAEPALALAGGADGMDFVRRLLRDAPAHLQPQAVLVLEIGHERAHFEAAFPRLEVVWLPTSAGDDRCCWSPAKRCSDMTPRHDHAAQPHAAPRHEGRAGAHDLTLHPGEKVGLVGRNGAGKSSLFALLADRLHADAGDFEIPPRWRLGEVAQTMPETDDGATDFVLQGDDAADASAGRSSPPPKPAATATRWPRRTWRSSEAGAFDARARAQALLLGLGFRVEQLDAPVNSFSGGWRMRLQLARALMCPADLLLLDEPTNHLDLDALVWLESLAQRFEGTMIVISHDREFLDAITRVTVHLDERSVDALHRQLQRLRGDARRAHLAGAGGVRASSRNASRTCSASSTASRPRPARPSRRKAASRRWRAWSGSRRC